MEAGYFLTLRTKTRMKKIFFMLLLASSVLLSAQAQIKGSGFYRVKNASSARWMTLCDNESAGIDYNSTTADCSSLVTNALWDEISCDPGSIFYLDSKGGESYNIQAQGTSIKEMIDYYINITPRGKYYAAWQELKGQRALLADKNSSEDKSWVVTTGNQSNWSVTPVNNSDNYLGVKPTLTVGNKHYAAFFTSFAYTLGQGMKAYYITKIDEWRGNVAYKEITGTVPAKTPVIIECNSTDVSKNQITPVVSSVAAPSDNKLVGVYFSIGNRWSGKYNAVKFDATKMRTLTLNSAGKLALTTSTDLLPTVILKEEANGEHLTSLAIPANSCYLPVSSKAPKEITLMTEAEYDTGISTVSATPGKTTYTVYTLTGVLVKKNAETIGDLPKGIYIINGKKIAL